ncbi:MAG TPA: glycosyltransferase family 1 protein [Gemmatimonadaceae bacterium]|nr:glycosyltransferase family 1 protein [Gemmatimonadaceae bacterium]
MTPRALRIAIFTDTYPPQINGVARTLARAVDALRSRGHDVRVVTTDDPGAGDEPGVHRFAGRPFYAYPQLRIALPSARRVLDAFGPWRPDLVHLATPFGVGLAGRRVARRLGVACVSSYHTSLATYAQFYGLGAISGLSWRFLRWFHNSTKLTLAPTHAIANELRAHQFVNVGVWGRGVDTTEYHPSWRSDALRTSWGARGDSVVITYVGRLAKEKGLDVVLSAMRAVAAERNDVIYVVAGSGPYELECRKLAPDGTIFTGHVAGKQLSETYASSDLFVFASVTDTLGNVVQEAMASGLVVVAADVPQTREVLAEGGVLFAPGDSEALAGALRMIIDSPSSRARLAESAEAAARSRSWTAIFDQLETSYLGAAAMALTSS